MSRWTAWKMPKVTYDVGSRALEIELDGHTVRVSGIPDARFHRQETDGSTDAAMWVSASEAEVLVKMIEYILGRVKITPASRTALESVLPRAREAAARDAASPAEVPSG